MSDLPNLRNLKFVIRTYANFRGLAKAYTDNEILQQPWEFESFVRGFNMGHSLCDFTDAGNGKECADEKIRGMTPLPELHLLR